PKHPEPHSPIAGRKNAIIDRERSLVRDRRQVRTLCPPPVLVVDRGNSLLAIQIDICPFDSPISVGPTGDPDESSSRLVLRDLGGAAGPEDEGLRRRGNVGAWSEYRRSHTGYAPRAERTHAGKWEATDGILQLPRRSVQGQFHDL